MVDGGRSKKTGLMLFSGSGCGLRQEAESPREGQKCPRSDGLCGFGPILGLYWYLLGY
jgi:hypothetical protein